MGIYFFLFYSDGSTPLDACVAMLEDGTITCPAEVLHGLKAQVNGLRLNVMMNCNKEKKCRLKDGYKCMMDLEQMLYKKPGMILSCVLLRSVSM